MTKSRLDLGNRRSPNIIKIRYRSAVNGRCAIAFAKVPYGGLFDLNEKLARMMATGQLLWFRVDAATPVEIGEHRSELARWLGALVNTSHITRVDWLA